MSIQEENLKAIADAIREKEGSADPIPAETFAERIRSLSGGGGSEEAAKTLVERAVSEAALPEGIETIGKYAFYYWDNLKAMTLPETLETIQTYAFGSSGIESVVIPAKVKTIASSAFRSCSSLKTVIFRGTPSSVANNSFSSGSITDIYVPWASGAVRDAPWGATGAAIHYDYVSEGN